MARVRYSLKKFVDSEFKIVANEGSAKGIEITFKRGSGIANPLNPT